MKRRHRSNDTTDTNLVCKSVTSRCCCTLIHLDLLQVDTKKGVYLGKRRMKLRMDTASMAYCYGTCSR